jgi:hypothetical protein
MELVLVPNFTSYTFTPLHPDSNLLSLSVLLPSFSFISLILRSHASFHFVFFFFVRHPANVLSFIAFHALVILPSIPIYYHKSLVFPYPILLFPPPKDTLWQLICHYVSYHAMPSSISYSYFTWILFTIQLLFLLLMHCLSSSSPSIPIPFSYLVISLLSKLTPHVVNTLLNNALPFLLVTATSSYFPRFFLILLFYSPLYYFSPHFRCLSRRLYCDITSSFPICCSFSLFSDSFLIEIWDRINWIHWRHGILFFLPLSTSLFPLFPPPILFLAFIVNPHFMSNIITTPTL